MSDLLAKTQLSDSKDCPPCPQKPVHQILQPREAKVGGSISIHRALPHRERRMIGAWCFLDHFGPVDLGTNGNLNVAPHPHIGLQTFTWLLKGKILHRDSLGNHQTINPGEVNLMTAGNGISHSEESEANVKILHGLQLWIALPDKDRHMAADFNHYTDLPILQQDNLTITVLAGEFLGEKAPVKVYSPLLGLNIHAQTEGRTTLPLIPEFEYGIFPIAGTVKVENETLSPDELLYLGCGRNELSIEVSKDAHLVIIGGTPFKEEILIWWNFVARTKEEITEASLAWNNQTRFGTVKGYIGDRLTAPEVPWKQA